MKVISLNPLPNDKILDPSKFKGIADNNLNVNENLKFALGKDRKHCGKRRKCCLPAFSPFPTMFSKGFFPRVVKSRDCAVKTTHSHTMTPFDASGKQAF